ncbi:MAG: hypothetical protein KatS3mg027_0275 [Bacteroidia bacterium]|nr:MAG: hypothetical protein KatS3mg027_0275 [Bacteroidia bacterium]
MSSNKLKKDILINLLFYGGMVVLGVLWNVVIIQFYDESVLGVFNQAYAVYIFLSQIAVGGVHLALQHQIPKYATDKKIVKHLTTSSLILSSATSIMTIVLSYLLVPVVVIILNSKEVGKALNFMLWGLFFFSANKIFLSVWNGLRQMFFFSLFQFLRIFFIFTIILLFGILKIDGEYLASSMSFSEFIIFLMAAYIQRDRIQLKINRRIRALIRMQNNFGVKAMVGNVLLDLNTKIDVLSLGVFLEDKVVGIYSFASTIFEGFSQLAVLFRSNVNPIITKVYFKRNSQLFKRVMNRSLGSLHKIMFLLGIASAVFFPVFSYFSGMKYVLETTIVYVILCLGFVITGRYQILLMIFNQLGNPKLQTLLIVAGSLTNLIFNFLMIPFIGIYGAALGTFLSFVVQSIFIRHYVNI